MSKNETLSAKQTKAILALLEHGTVTAAAAAVPCRRGTIYRWMQQPEFTAELRAAELRAIEELGRGLVGLGEDVLTVWRDAMRNDKTPWSVRERAANNAAGHILRYRELIDIEQRITALEERYNETHQ